VDARPDLQEATRLVFDSICVAQRELRLEVADRFEVLFVPDSQALVTIPELDPDARYRSRPHDGPLTALRAIGASEAAGTSVLAYLALDSPNCLAILCGLSRASVPARAIALGGAPPAWLGGLTGIKLEIAPVSIQDALAQSSLVIHHGGLSLTQEALFAGVPQLVVPRFVEQQLNGSAIERLGAGASRSNPSSPMVTRLVRQMLDDVALRERSAEIGRRLRATFPDGSADRIADRCRSAASRPSACGRIPGELSLQDGPVDPKPPSRF
jgi:hypothetical protein